MQKVFSIFGDKTFKVINYDIQSINNHLPKKRLSLLDAIKGKNTYRSRDNYELLIDRKEIELLASICPKEKLSSVYLPVIILRRRDLDRGTYVIGGELVEAFLVLKVIGKFKGKLSEFVEKYRDSAVYITSLEVIEIKKKLSTVITIAFA